MKCAGRSRAIANVDEPDAILFSHLEGKGDTGHHRHHVAEVRDLPDESSHQVAVVDVELATARGRVALRHVLLDDLGWLRALDQHRSEVADERRQHVSLRSIERIGAADSVSLLTERAEQAADYFRLAIQVDQPLFERAGESHVVVELQPLRSREITALTRGRQLCRLGRGSCRPRHLVRRFDAVSRVARLVKGDEKLLRIAIESTLTGLVSRNFDERVVAAFLAHSQLQCPEIAGESARPSGVSAPLHANFRKEFIGNSEHIHRNELGSEKVSHAARQVPGSVAGRTV